MDRIPLRAIATFLVIAFGSIGLALSSFAADRPPSKASLAAAAVHVRSGSRCTLHAVGSTRSVPVFADNAGVARFYAVRAARADPINRLALDCTDTDGKTTTYAVDLAADATFTPPPPNVADMPGVARPALQGNPLSYSQIDLLRRGYGLRPDPTNDAAAYRAWLASASQPGRQMAPIHSANTVTTSTAPNWTGAVQTGATDYLESQVTFNVPAAIPGGDGTQNTAISIWNGLGGNMSGPGGLIQGGIQISATPQFANYIIFREYCCGLGSLSNNYQMPSAPNPGDQIFSQEWYCDKSGSPSLSGGYGCSFVHDLTSGGILSCTSSSDATCPSVPAPANFVIGKSAEFVIELQAQPSWTDFSSQVVMAGNAFSQTDNKAYIFSTDPSVEVLTDFTNSTTHMQVKLGASDQVCFTIAASATAPVPQCGPTPPPPPVFAPKPVCTSSTDCAGVLTIDCTGENVSISFSGNCSTPFGEPTPCTTACTGDNCTVDAGGTVSWLGSTSTPNVARVCAREGSIETCYSVSTPVPTQCSAAGGTPNRCFSGLGSDELFCQRLNKCVPKSQYEAECLFQRPMP